MGARQRSSATSEVTIRRIYAGDTYVRVSTIGTSGERPFVLVPGIGVSSNYFERLAPNLNEFGPVHALDLPGFGGVPHPAQRLSIAQYADLVGLVIDTLGLHDPIVVGHSMGTQVVADLAARRPAISTLVLIGPVVDADERTIPRQARRFLASAVKEPGQIKTLALGSYLICGVKWFSRILPEMMQYKIEDQLPHIRASTLVIRGELDSVCPRQWTDRVADLLPRARAWEVSGAAHSVMYANAEQVALLCVEHARHPAPQIADVDLHRISERGREQDESGPSPGPGDSARAVGGRLKEWQGIVTDNDDLIAEGRTQHAEATQGHIGPVENRDPS